MWTSLMVAALVACGGDSDSLECIDNGYCDEGQACIEDVCEDVDCLTSAICDVGEYCNEKTYSCVDGCLEDADCVAGETCNPDSRTCEAYGCRNTELDCPVGTTCNTGTGDCDDVNVCQSCNQNNVNSCQTPGVTSYCLVWDDPSEGWCFPECGAGDTCPSGFYCYKNLQVDLWTTANICIADCPWLVDNGHL